MSKAFIDRNQQQNTQSNQSDTVQKKMDLAAQLKWINSQEIDQGWGVPAQMLAQEEALSAKTKAEEEEKLLQAKGLNINSDVALEKEADEMGEQAAQGKMANVTGNGSGVQRKTMTFTVPIGWGLAKIADHLGVSAQELKDLNKDKLKIWGEIQGFNAGEIIVYNVKSDKKEEKKDDPKKVIDNVYKEYKSEKISMPELGQILLPYLTYHPKKISSILKDLPFNEKDNLSYVLVSKADDSLLSTFPNDLLLEMKNALSNLFATTSWSKNKEQVERINKLLKVQNKKAIESPKSNFSKYQELVFDHEGGFVDDPVDKGGATNKGITFSTFKAYSKEDLGIEPTLENLKKLTNKQAEIIYKKRFWNTIKADEITNASLAYQVYDFNVNAGNNSIKELQKVLINMNHDIKVDGKLGNNTLKAINSEDSKKLFDEYKKARIKYYEDLVDRSVSEYKKTNENATEKDLLKYTQKKFLKGWLKRAKSITYEKD